MAKKSGGVSPHTNSSASAPILPSPPRAATGPASTPRAAPSARGEGGLAAQGLKAPGERRPRLITICESHDTPSAPQAMVTMPKFGHPHRARACVPLAPGAVACPRLSYGQSLAAPEPKTMQPCQLRWLDLVREPYRGAVQGALGLAHVAACRSRAPVAAGPGEQRIEAQGS